MSDLSQVEREQAAPLEREPALGPLVPRWFKVGFYGLFIPLSLLGVWGIVVSVQSQHALTGAVGVVRGSLAGQVESISSPQAQQAMEVLRKAPRYAFLYCNQEILQNPVNDLRMARALALQKALNWGDLSAQREVVGEIVAHMDDTGHLVPGFQVTPEMLVVLKRMVEERRNAPNMTYAEDRITAVIQWLADGQPGQPIGPEKQRLTGLLGQLNKGLFVGKEAEALRALMAEWNLFSVKDPPAASAAVKLQTMLDGKRTDFSPEETAEVAKQMGYYEATFLAGMTRLAEASRMMLDEVLRTGVYLDHPHVYQYLTLLGYELDPVRGNVVEGAWQLRHNPYVAIYMSEFVRTTTINPVMAVETERLTKEEHERQMNAQNAMRRRESVSLLGRIGLDYMAHPDQYSFGTADPEEFVREHITHALEEVAEDESVADLVAPALKALRDADAQRPGMHKLFTPEAD